MYVQARDGLLYKNPIVYGEDWFVCFCEDEPPEIVVKHVKSHTPKKMREEAEARLRGAGIDYEKMVLHSRAGRYFPPGARVFEATGFFFTLTDTIPIPNSHGGRVSPAKIDDDDCLIFWHDFATADVLRVLFGQETNELLGMAILPRRYFHYKSRKMYGNALKRALRKLFPWAKDATPEIANELPPVLRIHWR